MTIRQQVLITIERLTDDQLIKLLPVLLTVQNSSEPFSNESSQAYQDWLGAENDIYDEIFAEELAAR